MIKLQKTNEKQFQEISSHRSEKFVISEWLEISNFNFKKKMIGLLMNIKSMYRTNLCGNSSKKI